MTEPHFNLEESNEELFVPVDWLPRQKSNDSIFGELIRAPSYDKRTLIFLDAPVNEQPPK